MHSECPICSDLSESRPSTLTRHPHDQDLVSLLLMSLARVEDEISNAIEYKTSNPLIITLRESLPGSTSTHALC